MAFRLSKRSEERLEGVHPDLVEVVRLAIQITPHDFGVSEGVRDLDRQRDLVRRGLSQTLDSRHLTGHAVDLVAMDGRSAVWDWPAYYVIADAMMTATRARDTALRWGGAWHVTDIRETELPAEELSSDYVTLRRSEGRRPFLDGPHFELPRAVYP